LKHSGKISVALALIRALAFSQCKKSSTENEFLETTFITQMYHAEIGAQSGASRSGDNFHIPGINAANGRWTAYMG
jgi:hypothetical protein